MRFNLFFCGLFLLFGFLFFNGGSESGDVVLSVCRDPFCGYVSVVETTSSTTTTTTLSDAHKLTVLKGCRGCRVLNKTFEDDFGWFDYFKNLFS